PSLPARTTKVLIALVRSRPDQLAYASTGLGGLTHLATELLASMAQLKMIHVPYKSTGAAMADMVSGQCQLMVGSLLGTVTFFQTGKLRPLAVTSTQRWPTQPKLPTVAETLPGYEAVVWYGLLTPKGTPQSVIDRLNAEVNRILQDGAIRKSLEAQGMATSGGTPAKFGERIRADYQRWVKVVKEASIRVE
ncbi:MAG: tripartite tricarboxylate transporter substrate binding protein, partial [Burkholderiales bacterium]|nr:tripartite tricarboxylate transporter substrate binding protein [Burkholderiales bacterium]